MPGVSLNEWMRVGVGELARGEREYSSGADRSVRMRSPLDRAATFSIQVGLGKMWTILIVDRAMTSCTEVAKIKAAVNTAWEISRRIFGV